MPEDHRTFARNQQIDDDDMLLFKLAQLCLEHLDTGLHGTKQKHGYLQDASGKVEVAKEYREKFLDTMMDVAQELEMSFEEVQASWERVSLERFNRHEWAKES